MGDVSVHGDGHGGGPTLTVRSPSEAKSPPQITVLNTTLDPQPPHKAHKIVETTLDGGGVPGQGQKGSSTSIGADRSDEDPVTVDPVAEDSDESDPEDRDTREVRNPRTRTDANATTTPPHPLAPTGTSPMAGAKVGFATDNDVATVLSSLAVPGSDDVATTQISKDPKVS